MDNCIDAELLVCEYSHKQKLFHVTTLPDMIQMNNIIVCNGLKNDYVPFAICSDVTQANHNCDAIAKQKKIRCFVNIKNHIVSTADSELLNWFVAEYSYKNDKFRVRTFRDMLEKNMNSIMDVSGDGFIPFCITKASESAYINCQKMRDILNKKRR